VIEITKVNKQFKYMLRRTVIFRLSAAATAAAVAAAAAVASPPMLPPALSTPIMSPSISVIAHIPATPAPIKKKKIAALSYAPTSSGAICIHVARQLMELAQIKKEMCPIIAEEYTAGETAVMPCGHLFSKLAIHESFKKENNKCPACRQDGRPTFI
jgi:uncharacterized membrane protein